MKSPVITPVHPILPNSSPEILKPIPVKNGTLQVAWLPELDAHGLFYIRDEVTTILATHHNGYSCHALAERLEEGCWKPIVDQVEYIRNCGGMAIGTEFLEVFKS